tara:strand:+ start:328 stop:741 length:414 start_codon:yes stop_codon:yes gene_type:complete
MIGIQPINVSNTSLSPSVENRHNKFDVNQGKRHDFGEAHCVVCDVVFTKHHPQVTVCSRECKKKRRQAYDRKYREENLEKIKARMSKDYAKKREKRQAYNRKYREENCDEINARRRERRRAMKKENGNENGKTNIRF